MKIITAMVQLFTLNKVTYALENLVGCPGMAVTEARGFGRKEGPAEPAGGARGLKGADD